MSRIPKIIHYCWLSGDPFPADMAAWMATWKKILPEYEFMLWDRSRFPVESVPWVQEAFSRRKYAFAADYIRLHALYEYGGIYMDSDVEVLKPFGELLDRPFLIGYERNGNIEGGIIGAEPHAEWVKSCLQYYEGRHFIQADGSMDMTTLPKILKKSLEKAGVDETQILPWDYLTACSPHIAPKITENTRTVHHFYGSWLDSFRRAELLHFGKYRLVKIKRRTKKADFASPDYGKMFLPDEKPIITLLSSSWKKVVLLKKTTDI